MKKLLFDRILAIIILLACSLMITTVASAEPGVTRDIHPVDGGGAGMFEITLSFSSMEKGGIIETLPPGVLFKSTTIPQDRVSQSGNILIFAVINDTPIHYLVQNSDGSQPDITGKWEDIKQGMKGDVVPAGQPESQSSKESTPSDTMARSPGFGVFVALLALALVPGVMRRVKK